MRGELVRHLRAIPPRRRVLLVAVAVGFLVVLAAWWAGPGLFAGGSGSEQRVVTATVTEPVPCTQASPVETVRFSLGREKRDATLSGCGHSKGERVEIAIPHEAVAGPLTVRTAEAAEGFHDLRRPVGLLLVALSCLGGGCYAFLVTRAPPSPPGKHAQARLS